MYLLLLFLFLPETILAGSAKCGGQLSAAKGTISTPNFPNKFDEPIHCEWVINSLDFGDNASIIVYLTQLYLFEGLTFTEYQTYVDGFPSPGKKILTITEDNVSSSRYVQCHMNFLVITLDLNSIEGTHLRVLESLMDVYGFNITYEISTAGVRKDTCTMSNCGFTGYCYDYNTHFSCDCFPGYEGKDCSQGPKSLCYSEGQCVCKNGATCRHMGDYAFTCICKPGFMGSHCDILKPAQSTGCEDCLISCPFDGTLENVCKCPRTRKALSVNDSIGYSTTICLNFTSHLEGHELKGFLRKYITKQLQASVPKIEDIQVLDIRNQSNLLDIMFRFYAPKKDDKRIRNTITKWALNGAIGNYSLNEKDILITTDPYLHLQSVSVNKVEIREKEEFILSCVARGSRNMVFRWFKNGSVVKINPAVSAKKWTRLIPEGENRYTALLGIEKASKWDEGEFTCQVEDYGIQQCRSRIVYLRHPPTVYLDPISLTVNKGEPFVIKCLTRELRIARKYSYSWTKDKQLLRTTETEHSEVLYPSGSILQVSGLHKTATYSCLVQDGTLWSEESITVVVVDRNVITLCPEEKFEGYIWNETAPGCDFKHKCPKNYHDLATRSCIMLETGEAKWHRPDYSNCSPFALDNAIYNFFEMTEGYETTTTLDSLDSIAHYVNSTVMLPGEGNKILELLTQISNFNNISNYSKAEDVSVKIFGIVDDILEQEASLNKENQVLQLQKLIKTQLLTIEKPSDRIFPLHLKNLIINVEAHEHSPYPQFMHSTMTRVVYKNLLKFIRLKSVIRLDDDRDIEYEIISRIVAVWGSNVADGFHFHIFVHAAASDSNEWDLRCALAEFASSNYAWDTNVCYSNSINLTATVCNCSKQGTMALLLVKESKAARHESPHPYDIIILIGCSTCLLLCSLCGILLLCNWIYHRSSFTFLKLQCCTSISGVMTVFIVAFCNELHKDYYLYTMSLLEVFFFMGMSSQLSTLLIVYSELVEISKKESIKQTVVGIITGAPLIVVFANYLAMRTMDKNLSHWWILQGSLSFNLFTSCVVIMFILFVVLYCLVEKMIKCNKTSGSRFLNNRSKLIKKTSLIFYTIILLTSFSIVFVNITNDIIWHYVFSASSILTGVVILVCLIFKPQFFSKKTFFEKFHLQTKSTDNVSASPHKTDRGRDESDQGMNLHLSASNNSDLSPSIQQYNSSPTQFNPVPKSNSLNSPDILGTKSFAQFDLVASSLHSTSNIMPVSPVEPLDNPPDKKKITVAITKAFDEPLNLANETVSEKVVKFCDTVQYDTKVSNEHLDAVMDSISNDLNYLLNGHVELNDKTLTSHKSCSKMSRNAFDDNGIPC